MTGYLQVYTGNGKGKTTAAIGLTIRAVGAGLKVFFIQFLKQGDYSEIKALSKFSDQIIIEQYGMGKFVKGKPSREDIQAGQQGLARIKAVMAEDKYDLIIIDEGSVAVKYGLFSIQDFLAVIDKKPPRLEIIVTGRFAARELIERADLVTEMKELKHYYHKGVPARIGIEK